MRVLTVKEAAVESQQPGSAIILKRSSAFKALLPPALLLPQCGNQTSLVIKERKKKNRCCLKEKEKTKPNAIDAAFVLQKHQFDLDLSPLRLIGGSNTKTSG